MKRSATVAGLAAVARACVACSGGKGQWLFPHRRIYNEAVPERAAQ